jgi:hypothetical protein
MKMGSACGVKVPQRFSAEYRAVLHPPAMVVCWRPLVRGPRSWPRLGLTNCQWSPIDVEQGRGRN